MLYLFHVFFLAAYIYSSKSGAYTQRFQTKFDIISPKIHETHHINSFGVVSKYQESAEILNVGHHPNISLAHSLFVITNYFLGAIIVLDCLLMKSSVI